MAAFKFIFISHWRTRSRWIILVLVLATTVGMWFVCQKQTNDENRVAVGAFTKNKVLIAGVKEKTLAKVGLERLPKLTKQADSAQVQREAVLTSAALKGSFGVAGSSLLVTNRFGNISLTSTLLMRNRLAKRLTNQGGKLSSARYGVRDWPFMVSLLPVLTSIAGVFLVTFMLMWEDLRVLFDNRRQMLTLLPAKKSQLIGVQTLVFFCDLLIFIFAIFTSAYLTAHVLGGSTATNYPIITRTGATIHLMGAYQVVAMALLLYMCACMVMYLGIRLVIVLFRGVRTLIAKEIIALGTYWLFLGQAMVSQVPALFTNHVLALWLPTTYMQASRVIFGTDYLQASQAILTSLDMYGGNDEMTARLMMSMSFENLSYYNGATVASLYGATDSLFMRAVGLLMGTSIIFYVGLVWLTHRRNRLL